MGLGTGKYGKANDGQNLAIFPSVLAGLEATAKNLAGKLYFGSGKTAIDDITKRWVGGSGWVNDSANARIILSKLGISNQR